jgi:hypothetical protein
MAASDGGLVESWNLRAVNRFSKQGDAQRAPPCVQHLFLDHLFNLPDLLLDFACELFRLAFVLQVRVVGDLPYFFFHFAFHFVELAFHLILSTRFHVFSFFASGLQQENI